MMKNAKKSLVNVLCAVLLFSIMVFGMTGCGKEQKSDGDEKNDIEDSFDSLSEEDKEVPEEDDVEKVKDGKDELVEGPVGPGDSWEIEVGTRGIIIDIPLDAENVHAGSYSLSYDQGSINVEYSDSFCELTEDALEDLTDYYDIWNDQSDSLSNIKPVETQVGGRDAYYCRAVDSMEYVCYIFFVDIGEENYLDVTILGSVDELSEERAFELADLEFR